MKVRTQVVLVLAMIAALLAATPGVGAQENPVTDPSPPESISDEQVDVYQPFSREQVEKMAAVEMGYWQNFREGVGLPSSESEILEIVRTDEGRRNLEMTSVPLTDAESDRLSEHAERSSLVGEFVYDAELDKRDDFGGYYRVRSTGEVVINFTTEVDQATKSRLETHVSNDPAVTFRVVEHSLKELRAEQDRILNLNIAGVVGVGVDTKTNKVLIGIADEDLALTSPGKLTPDEASARGPGPLLVVTAAVQEPGMAAIEFESGALQDDICNFRTNCGTAGEEFRGGIELDMDVGSRCTTGFVMTDSVLNDFVVTAGHCEAHLDDPSTNDDGEIGGQSSSSANHFIDTSTHQNTMWNYTTGAWRSGETRTADATLFGILDSRKGNRIYKSQAYTSWFINARLVGNARPGLGDTICISGVTSLYKCGEVTDPNYPSPGSTSFTGVTLSNQIRYKIIVSGWDQSFKGSSGGSVFGDPDFTNTKRAAVGIHVRSNATNIGGFLGLPAETRILGVVSPIDAVEASMNADMRDSASNP